MNLVSELNLMMMSFSRNCSYRKGAFTAERAAALPQIHWSYTHTVSDQRV